MTVAGSGGTPPYQYKLGAGSYQASGILENLLAGSYTVTVQDANLCTFDVPGDYYPASNCTIRKYHKSDICFMFWIDKMVRLL